MPSKTTGSLKQTDRDRGFVQRTTYLSDGS